METQKIWRDVLGKILLNNSVDQDVKNDYLPFCYLSEIDENFFAVVAKTNLGVSLVKQFAVLIEKELALILNKNIQLEVVTVEKLKEIVLIQKDKSKKIKRLFECNFENFVVGKSNRQAFVAAKKFAEEENSKTFNPLFIYGDSGLGKTHLLESIVNLVESKNHKIMYTNADLFTSAVVGAINSGDKEIDKFKEMVLQHDFFIMDDVHFLTKRDKTNEFLFFVINNFLESGKKLAFSSDKNPESLNGFEKRMITRFNFGLSVGIEPLDYETAKNILKLRIREFGLEKNITEEAINFLAENFGDDARKIKSLANRLELLILSSDKKDEISLTDVADFFSAVPSSNLGILNVKKIKEVVGNKYGVTPKAIDGRARTTAIKDARHVSMYFAKVILNHTSTQIGAEFGGKDHSTVLSAIARIEKNIYADAGFKKLIVSLKNKITST